MGKQCDWHECAQCRAPIVVANACAWATGASTPRRVVLSIIADSRTIASTSVTPNEARELARQLLDGATEAEQLDWFDRNPTPEPTNG